MKTQKDLLQHESNIVKLFKLGIPCTDLAKTYNIGYDTMYRFLKRVPRDIGKRQNLVNKKLLRDNKDLVIKMYQLGKTTYQIAREFGYNASNIYSILKRNNIKMHGQRKYSLNHNFFDKINNEYKAYILGFMYADGNVSSREYCFIMSQNEDDKYILERMKDILQYTGSLRFSERTFPQRNMYSLSITSKQCHQSLIEKGCVPRKSLILDWVGNHVPDHLISHFVRGYFDGDGCIVRKSGYVSVTSSDKFLLGLQKHLSGVLDNSGKFSYDKRCLLRGSPTGNLRFSGRKSSKQFLDYIYSNITDKSLKMDRKYNLYLQYYGSN